MLLAFLFLFFLLLDDQELAIHVRIRLLESVIVPFLDSLDLHLLSLNLQVTLVGIVLGVNAPYRDYLRVLQDLTSE